MLLPERSELPRYGVVKGPAGHARPYFAHQGRAVGHKRLPPQPLGQLGREVRGVDLPHHRAVGPPLRLRHAVLRTRCPRHERVEDQRVALRLCPDLLRDGGQGGDHLR
ncbi:MAG: hypothetical protein JWO59_354, partial [Chloroflexi bacterium]|nr:hypothetical protein [Chloroflexota bacterium]